MDVVGGEDEPRFAPRWAASWELALEELGEDAESIDRQLEHVYWRLARWPEKYSYPAVLDGSTSARLTFAKRAAGLRLRIWYWFDDKELELLWVDIAPYDDGQDDPL